MSELYIKNLCIKTEYNILYTTITYTDEYLKQNKELEDVITKLNDKGYLIDYFDETNKIQYITDPHDIQILDTFFILNCNMNSLYNKKFNNKDIYGGYTKNNLKTLNIIDDEYLNSKIQCNSDKSIHTNFSIDASTEYINGWYIGGYKLNTDCTLSKKTYITNKLTVMDINSNFEHMNDLIFYNNGNVFDTNGERKVIVPGYHSKNLYISGFLNDVNGNINPKLIWHISCHDIEWRDSRTNSRPDHECCPEYHRYKYYYDQLHFLRDSKIHFQIDIIGDDNSLIHNICFKCFRLNSKRKIVEDMYGLIIDLTYGVNPINTIMEQIYLNTDYIKHNKDQYFNLKCCNYILNISPNDNNKYFNIQLNTNIKYGKPIDYLNGIFNLSLGNISDIGLYRSNTPYGRQIRINSIEYVNNLFTNNYVNNLSTNICMPYIRSDVFSFDALQHTMNNTIPNPNRQGCQSYTIVNGGTNNYLNNNQSLNQKYIQYKNKYYS